MRVLKSVKFRNNYSVIIMTNDTGCCVVVASRYFEFSKMLGMWMVDLFVAFLSNKGIAVLLRLRS